MPEIQSLLFEEKCWSRRKLYFLIQLYYHNCIKKNSMILTQGDFQPYPMVTMNYRKRIPRFSRTILYRICVQDNAWWPNPTRFLQLKWEHIICGCAVVSESNVSYNGSNGSMDPSKLFFSPQVNNQHKYLINDRIFTLVSPIWEAFLVGEI